MKEIEYDTVSYKIESEIRGIFADPSRFELEQNNFKVLIVQRHSAAWSFFADILTIEEEGHYILVTRDKVFSSEYDAGAMSIRDLVNKMRAYIQAQKEIFARV